ncbi:MAG TPA: hypothetical protein VLA93_18595, partial [Pyrinomonadaceae bacterium]|nr:hypothetical protein [Pyrinomonadaceae bacterium]
PRPYNLGHGFGIKSGGFCEMKKPDLFNELLTIYERHGWQLKAALLTPETVVELNTTYRDQLESISVNDSPVDALWFARPSHQQREAWELRLLSETQYALFETFEADETEEQRQEMRQEMEARMRDYVQK